MKTNIVTLSDIKAINSIQTLLRNNNIALNNIESISLDDEMMVLLKSGEKLFWAQTAYIEDYKSENPDVNIISLGQLPHDQDLQLYRILNR